MQEIVNQSVEKHMIAKLYVFDCRISVADAVKDMIETGIDSILISEKDDVIGIVTNKDVLEKVVAQGKDPNTTKLKEITSAPIVKIHKDSKVLDAISLMNKYDIRRLLVTNDVRPVGLITRKHMVGNIAKNYVSMPEFESEHNIRCPYCQSVFLEKGILSRHIDEIHIGKGLLQGNLNKK